MQKKFIALTALAIMVCPFSADAAGKNGVAAEINGQKIMVNEIEKAYNSNPMFKEQMKFADFYEKFLDPYINGKMLYKAAQKAGVENTAEYKDQLAILKEELANKIYLDEQVEKKIKKSDIEKVYNGYKTQFKPEKEVKAKHILVSD